MRKVDCYNTQSNGASESEHKTETKIYLLVHTPIIKVSSPKTLNSYREISVDMFESSSV